MGSIPLIVTFLEVQWLCRKCVCPRDCRRRWADHPRNKRPNPSKRLGPNWRAASDRRWGWFPDSKSKIIIKLNLCGTIWILFFLPFHRFLCCRRQEAWPNRARGRKHPPPDCTAFRRSPFRRECCRGGNNFESKPAEERRPAVRWGSHYPSTCPFRPAWLKWATISRHRQRQRRPPTSRASLPNWCPWEWALRLHPKQMSLFQWLLDWL